MLKHGFKKALSALLASAVCLTQFAAVSAEQAPKGPDSDITNWTMIDSTMEMTADGYKLSGSNNEFALSDKNAKDFTLSSTVKVDAGEGKCTYVYGAANSHNTFGWRGIEIWKKSDTTGEIKAFVERGPELISPTAFGNVNWNDGVEFKIEMSGTELTVTVGDKTLKANDTAYVGGTVGLLAYNTTALFNHIRFTGSEAYEGESQIKNWYAIDNSRLVETKDYYQIDNPDGDAFMTSNVGAFAFELSADMKIVTGDRATLVYGLSEQHIKGNWHGVEFCKTGDTTGKISAFLAGADPFIKDAPVENVNWNDYNNIKIVMDADNKLTVFVNDEKIGEGVDNDYFCGSLGLLSFRTCAQFKNIKYSVPAGNVTSEITEWYPQESTFFETDGGYVLSGEDNNFALTAMHAANFELSANVKPLNGHKIATLTYGNQSAVSTGAWHGVEFKANDNGTANFKSFVVNAPEMFIKEGVTLSTDEYQTFKIRVIGNDVTVYLNGEEIGKYTDDTYNGGYAGLLTYGTTTLFNNIKYRDLSNTDIAELKVDGVAAVKVGDKFEVEVDKAASHTVAVTLSDEDAKYEISADQKTVTVTAQDGTVKTYTLEITEKEETTTPGGDDKPDPKPEPKPDPKPGDNNNVNKPADNKKPAASKKASVKKITIKQGKKTVKTIKIKLKKKTIRLKAVVTGKNLTKAYKKISWTTSKKKIATVSSKGVVKLKKKGTVKITAKNKKSGKKATVKIIIKK